MDSTHAYNFWTLGHPRSNSQSFAFEFVMQKYDDSAILIRYCHEPTKAKHWAPSISLHDQTSHTRQPIVQCAITPILCHCENSAHEGNAISLVVRVLERLATNASRDDADSSRLARSRRRRLLRDGIYKTGTDLFLANEQPAD